MFQNSKPYQSQLNIRENDLLSSPLSKSKDSNIFLDGLFQQKQIKTGQINEIEIKALVVGKENVGKSLFISKMIVETIYSNILTYLKLDKRVNLLIHKPRERFKYYPEKSIIYRNELIWINFVEFTSKTKVAPVDIKNFDFLYFIIEDTNFNEGLEELTRRFYSLKNWKLAKKEIIIIVNKRIASKIYEQVMKFEPNLFWKNLNLKRIHSFYLDITTLKNLKKVLPPILTHPLECCFEGDSLSMSELSNCYISDSIKMMVGKGQNLNTGEILDNPLMFSSMVGRKISRKKKNCSIF